MAKYKKLTIIAGVLDLLILLFTPNGFGTNQASIIVFLNLLAISIPFAIRNPKAAGITLLAVSIITVLVTGPAGIPGFVLFVVSSGMALRHSKTEEERKKRRKAAEMLLYILERINDLRGWDERARKIYKILRKYDKNLPDVSDIQNLKNYLNSIIRESFQSESPRHGKAINVMVGLPAAIALMLVTAPSLGATNSAVDISGNHGHSHHGHSHHGHSHHEPSNNGPGDHICSYPQVFDTKYNKCVEG